MNKLELKELLLQKVDEQLRNESFRLNKRLSEFTRRTKEGWHKFQLIFLDFEDYWEIKIGLLIRKNVIENIFHKGSYFAPEYHKSTATIGIDLENLMNDEYYRFLLKSESDLDFVVKAVNKAFYDIALKFFEEYDSIEAIDRALNMDVGQSIFSGYKYGGNTGIIAAKLVGNPSYNSLVEKYRVFYTDNFDGFYLEEFNNIVNSLVK
ncbi:hypothetical protein E6C50_02110 [Flavobacterium supellecticarium]|uniref:Uncharacterized protein n=1 Tax=Flavobacterium supellecticarium TaxID=2565924 RepID=A0A4S4A512_9FLAO|nr:hypothetical protein [Flavobacterium supellecticarium]THF53025.1 hypothetical protein E6C50_02110 [Flavobacterium supellecticarium]